MGISIPQLLIILAILLLLFGTKRLRSIGSDLGDAVKNFRKAMTNENDEQDAPAEKQQTLDQKDADFRQPSDAASQGQKDQDSSAGADSHKNAP